MIPTGSRGDPAGHQGDFVALISFRSFHKHKNEPGCGLVHFCDPDRTRTCNLTIKSRRDPDEIERGAYLTIIRPIIPGFLPGRAAGGFFQAGDPRRVEEHLILGQQHQGDVVPRL